MMYKTVPANAEDSRTWTNYVFTDTRRPSRDTCSFDALSVPRTWGRLARVTCSRRSRGGEGREKKMICRRWVTGIKDPLEDRC